MHKDKEHKLFTVILQNCPDKPLFTSFTQLIMADLPPRTQSLQSQMLPKKNSSPQSFAYRDKKGPATAEPFGPN
ncbi:hypothetical protein KDD30_04100 [Photobacterium sp. GJ3]|uniref:hypothetical protein n=1 Tax=Photobacterium sp. GJ3 TaxID=2829502 RepID=UPI001B8CFBD3|nr:hypothetical protein [Photobacterium sp. GJ3]QUJ68325.1 hypothetical protein KDD30_04100 [Photobacterium sp. GJ3]